MQFSTFLKIFYFNCTRLLQGPSRLELSKPLIAAVSGFAVAGGLELALLADLRVVEESAVMGVFCRRFGTSPPPPPPPVATLFLAALPVKEEKKKWQFGCEREAFDAPLFGPHAHLLLAQCWKKGFWTPRVLC